MEYFSKGWDITKDNFLAWVILFVVYTAIVPFTLGFGAILSINLWRATKTAIEGNKAPVVGDLFQFDRIVDDIILLVLLLISMCVGFLFCCVGYLVAAILFFWAPLLLADGKLSPMNAMKASLGHAKGEMVAVLIFLVLVSVTSTLGAIACGVGIYLALPVIYAAQWSFFMDHRDEIYQLAEASGLDTL
jgi:uncharacterized membrane protein